MNDINIYVITHKEVNLDKLNLDDCYKLLMVGKKKYNLDNYLFDSVGDNISNKNTNYCELTGLYWIWKHDKSKYVGLCHYRRFFTNNYFKILDKKKILKLLNKYDIIIPHKEKIPEHLTVYTKYRKGHIISDLDECKNIISEKYPEYIDAFDEFMNGRYIHFKNMFIMKRELLDDYCEWLFSILNELEKRIDLTDRNDFQKRVYGFLSERLFCVWIIHNKYKIYDSIVYETEGSKFIYLVKIILNFLHIFY